MLPGLVLKFYEEKNIMEYTKRESSDDTKSRLVRYRLFLTEAEFELVLIVRLAKLL